MAQITLRNYLQETEDAISSKRVDEALASCQYVLAFFPESLEAQRLLGEVYLAQEKLEDAQQSFDWILTNDPENVIAYCSRALVSERMSDYDTALDCYQQAYELSRGNGQIRQAFNQLSEKVGQPGFMFSRAGLARLYMRGDLLTQAAQEWETVLAITPDRLDARTGLLEVYWRQGLYDRAAQLAEQILQDVPGCLKALLILAFVTAPQDMLRSKELIKQVEALDPDLVLGHDLFADHLNRHPNDPFLKLLRKSPATLGTAEQATKTASAQSASAFNQLNAAGSPISADALSSWGSNASWNNDETLLKSRSSEPALKADTPSQSSTWGNESWSGIGNPPTESTQTSSDGSEQAEPWQLLQNALNSISPDVVRQASNPGFADANATPWLGADSFSPLSQSPESSLQSVSDAGLSSNDSSEQPDEQSWSFAIPEETKNNNAVPAWLNQLTNNEKQALQDQPLVEQSAPKADPFVIKPVPQSPAQQPDTQVPARPPVQQSSVKSSTSQPAVPEPEKPVPAQPVAESESMPDWARMMQSDGDEDSDEESFFGPDWLKSLGATSLDGTGEFFKLTDESEQPAEQKASDTAREQSVSNPEPLAPVLEQPQITPERSKTNSSPAWEQPAEQPRTGSNPSWEQPVATPEAPKAQAFHDPSWLLEPAPQQKKASNPSWEQIPSEVMPTNTSSQGQLEDWQPSAQASVDPTTNQSAEEPQGSQENDPWLAWQATYAQPQQDASPLWPEASQQPAEAQDYWSSSSQGQQNAKAPEQPSWMQQLSQSSSPASSNQGYDDWAASLAAPSAQQPEVAQEPEISAQPQLNEGTPADVSSAPEDPWAKLNQQLQSQAVDYNWLAQLAGNSQAGIEPVQSASAPAGAGSQSDNQQDKVEQNVLTTLEDLEKKLLSRGFAPLEPNSLASIAQAQEQQSVAETEPEHEVQPDADSGPSLSSALAELGNFFPQPVNSSDPKTNAYSASANESTHNQQSGVEPSWLAALNPVPAQQVAEEASTSATEAMVTSEPSVEPSWLAALNSVPTHPVAEDVPTSISEANSNQEPVAEPSWLAALNTVPAIPASPTSEMPEAEKPSNEVAAMQSVAQTPVKNRETEKPPVTPQLQAEPSFQASNRVSIEPMQAPVARINPLLDSELETTMKRPAVRLQPMHQRTAGVRESGSSGAINRNRAGERVAQRQTDSGNNLSQRERLIRGYQAQLIGDFDNAMQEYRVIIRNAPELLGEVVSNVRALLKLAPNYSAGYRVLGDAYMRQGEYLQAMEAYNKALTMAKKAKG
ncbi:hypothetical protein KDW_02160 [Dictyobacter vulcani]|uniref:Bacterial transcriptional activator domain-containing protein n=1 Tax=Dictyobacter vulcani TaxID=2607529 RepID=A0A5J4KBN2_9CHLR|nr:tetratricopeptide repeat protein [Dictyobacter vulcani]GER86054.1 hypothetical protein KDW_02160 [Dictyobacter vulcani]